MTMVGTIGLGAILPSAAFCRFLWIRPFKLTGSQIELECICSTHCRHIPIHGVYLQCIIFLTQCRLHCKDMAIFISAVARPYCHGSTLQSRYFSRYWYRTFNQIITQYLFLLPFHVHLSIPCLLAGIEVTLCTELKKAIYCRLLMPMDIHNVKQLLWKWKKKKRYGIMEVSQ